ncbi:GAF domain-containing SpoIIE family protein phosphatase [Actinoplanes sp. NPDC024001]|uniref:PP2C family protein-serine/threonine phosphatase n=1 Tax=Actinoplanes sp. NPDC024001 TaxID=3154598 RepID=UPI0033E586EE
MAAANMQRSERLRRFADSTCAALSRIQSANPLDEIRKLLSADTATFLLFDETAGQLIPVAARGLEEELLHGIRISYGRGFAGQIAKSRQLITINNVNSANVVNPVLIERGLRSLLGAPVITDEQLVGVLHVGTLTRRDFTAEDVQMLQSAADRLSEVRRLSEYARERIAVSTLSRSLIPAGLPTVAGLELAARYVPVDDSGVGGDWYDAFPLPSGWLGVVMGDVCGRGPSAAVAMGRARSALRSYSLLCADPAAALSFLDREVHHFENDRFTTCLYLMISPERAAVRISSAGHLRPILCAGGHAVELTDIPVDPPLGTGELRLDRRSVTMAFPSAGTLVCYTDGLVERRDQPIDVGIRGLLAAACADTAEGVCSAIMAAAPRQPEDDMALLAVSRRR